MTAQINSPAAKAPERSDTSDRLVETIHAVNRLVNAGAEVRARERLADIESQLTSVAALLTPGATWVSVSLLAPGQKNPRSLATGDRVVAQLDALQHRTQQGPTLAALTGPDLEVTSPDLHTDQRWPALADELRGSASPVHGVTSRALFVPDDHRACLTLYHDGTSNGPDAVDVAAAVAAVGFGLSSLLHRRRADNLGHALDSNRLIGAALGVLIARHRWTYNEAFERMRTASQRGHRKLHDLADEVITTGDLPAA